MPKVSIISPSYNQEKYLDETIESVLSQTFTDFEFIVTDNASTDGTWRRLQTYNDPRLKILHLDHNRGPIGGAKNSLAESTGEYLGLLPTDDLYEPHTLQILVNHLDKHPEALGVFGLHRWIDEDSNFMDRLCLTDGVGKDRYYLLNKLFYGLNLFSGAASLFRRSAFQHVGYYAPYHNWITEMLLWAKFLFHGELHIIPEYVYRHRERANHANLSALTPPTYIGMQFETLKLLEIFRNKIDDIDLLHAIFPEVSKHSWPLEEALIEFHLAHLALSAGNAHHRLFGLTILYELMSDPSMAKYLSSACSFDYQNLFQLESEQPIFCDYARLNMFEDTLLKRIFDLQDHVESLKGHCEHLERLQLNITNSTSWQITAPIRQLKTLISPSSKPAI